MPHLVHQGVALVVDGGEDAWSATELAASLPQLSAIWHRSGASTSEPRLLEGVFDDGGPAFVQVNPEVADLIRDYVAEVAGSGEHAVDAYCGVGVYGRALAEKGWGVTGIERQWENYLRGRLGERSRVVDALAREVAKPPAGATAALPREVEPIPAQDVYLSLDLDLQREAEAVGGDFFETGVDVVF